MGIKKKRLKRIITLLLGVLLLLAGMQIFFLRFADKLLEKTLTRMLEGEKQSQQITFSDIEYHYLAGKLIVEDFLLIKKAGKNGEVRRISFHELQIKGINPVQLIPGVQMNLKSIEIRKPFFDIYQENENTQKHSEKYLLEKIKELDIDEIYVRNASLAIHTHHRCDTLRNISFRLDSLWPKRIEKNFRPSYWLKNLHFEIGTNTIPLKNGVISFESAENQGDSLLLLYNFSLKLKGTKSQIKSFSAENISLKLTHNASNSLAATSLITNGSRLVLNGFAQKGKKKNSKKTKLPAFLAQLKLFNIKMNKMHIDVLDNDGRVANSLSNLNINIWPMPIDAHGHFQGFKNINIHSGAQELSLGRGRIVSFDKLLLSQKQRKLSLQGIAYRDQQGNLVEIEKIICTETPFRFNQDSIRLGRVHIEKPNIRYRTKNKKHSTVHKKLPHIAIDNFSLSRGNIKLMLAGNIIQADKISAKWEAIELNEIINKPLMLQEKTNVLQCTDFTFRGKTDLDISELHINKGLHFKAKELRLNEPANSFSMTMNDVDFPALHIGEQISAGKSHIASLKINAGISHKKGAARFHKKLNVIVDELSIDLIQAEKAMAGNQTEQIKIFGFSAAEPSFLNSTINFSLITFDSSIIRSAERGHKLNTDGFSCNMRSKKIQLNQIVIESGPQVTSFGIDGHFQSISALLPEQFSFKKFRPFEDIEIRKGKAGIRFIISDSSGTKAKKPLPEQISALSKRIRLNGIKASFLLLQNESSKQQGGFFLQNIDINTSGKSMNLYAHIRDIIWQQSGQNMMAGADYLKLSTQDSLLHIGNFFSQAGGISESVVKLNSRISDIKVNGIDFSTLQSPGFRSVTIDTLDVSLEEKAVDSKIRHHHKHAQHLPDFRLKINNGRLGYRNRENGSSVRVRDFKLLINSSEEILKARNYSQGIAYFGMAHLHASFRNKQMLSLSGLQYRKSERKLKWDSLLFRPIDNRYAFQDKLRFQDDWTLISTASGNIDEFAAYTDSGHLNIDGNRAEIRHFLVDDYRDKRLPPNPSRRPKLPAEMLHGLPFRLQLDSLEMMQARIEYSEHEKDAIKPGQVYFDEVNIKALNLSNKKSRLKLQPQLKLSANGRLQGQARAYVSIGMSLTDEEQSFRIGASMGAMSMKSLNKVLEHLAFIRIHSGEIDMLQFTASGNKNVATGEMTFLYDDLKIRVLNRKTLKQNFGDSMLAFLANTFVLKKSNPRLIIARDGPMYFERNLHKSVFNYWAKLIMSGIKSSIGFEKNKTEKKIRKLRED